MISYKTCELIVKTLETIECILKSHSAFFPLQSFVSCINKQKYVKGTYLICISVKQVCAQARNSQSIKTKTHPSLTLTTEADFQSWDPGGTLPIIRSQ